MRKVSIIALVVILASGLSVAAYAVSGSNQASTTIDVNSSISVRVIQGGSFSFNNGNAVSPGSSYDATDATKLQVKANNDLEWDLSTEKSTDSSSATIVKSALTVTPGVTGGTGNSSAFFVDYDLDVPANMPTGEHTITVTFTASTD